MARVLFVCLHNAGRSQMSQALFERAAAASARATRRRPPARRRASACIPRSSRSCASLTSTSPIACRKLLTDELARWADVVVTMGCGDACPYVPGVRYLDWDLPDPKGRPLEDVRATRDEIGRRVEELLATLGP